MRDSIGKIPKIKSVAHALKEIRKIALGKRGHVLLDEQNEWLELKLKVIALIAYRGLYQ